MEQLWWGKTPHIRKQDHPGFFRTTKSWIRTNRKTVWDLMTKQKMAFGRTLVSPIDGRRELDWVTLPPWWSKQEVPTGSKTPKSCRLLQRNKWLLLSWPSSWLRTGNLEIRVQFPGCTNLGFPCASPQPTSTIKIPATSANQWQKVNSNSKTCFCWSPFSWYFYSSSSYSS